MSIATGPATVGFESSVLPCGADLAQAEGQDDRLTVEAPACRYGTVVYRLQLWPRDLEGGVLRSGGGKHISSGETRVFDVAPHHHEPAVSLRAKVYVPDATILAALPISDLVELLRHPSDAVREATFLAICDRPFP